MLSPVTVRKILPDGSQWGEWQGFRLPSSTCALIWTPLGTDMCWYYNTWPAKFHEVTFFWPEKWYVIHAFYSDHQQFSGCYCDIVMPNPAFPDGVSELYYTDLYVDVVVGADHSVTTKDQEMYERAMRHHTQLQTLHTRAFAELDALADHAREWTGPFEHIQREIIRLDWHTLNADSSVILDDIQTQWRLPK